MGPPVDPGQSFGGTGGPGAKPPEAPRFYGLCRVNEVFKFIFLCMMFLLMSIITLK